MLKDIAYVPLIPLLVIVVLVVVIVRIIMGFVLDLKEQESD